MRSVISITVYADCFEGLTSGIEDKTVTDDRHQIAQFYVICQIEAVRNK